MPESTSMMTRASVAFLLGFVGLLYFAVQETLAVLAAQNGVAVDGANRSKYVGDAACVSCHKVQSLPYVHTSHHLTSQLVKKDSVLGSFREGSNVLTIVDAARTIAEPGLYFKMEAKDGG